VEIGLRFPSLALVPGGNCRPIFSNDYRFSRHQKWWTICFSLG
jgi:hypothetical protein